MLVATDRLSAFDRGICSVPNKGQVLNRLAAFWHRYAGIGVLNDFGRAGGKRERERGKGGFEECIFFAGCRRASDRGIVNSALLSCNSAAGSQGLPHPNCAVMMKCEV